MTANLGALLQLASPALPVGAFSYSQGLESAIEIGAVHDEASTQKWLQDGLLHVLAHYEAPVWLRLFRALGRDDREAFGEWNDEFLATRESAELRAETEQMGYSLGRLLSSLDHALPESIETLSWPAAHALTCRCWDVDEYAGLTAYLYGWCENQVTCALKSVPLGQTSGQRLLIKLRPTLAKAIEVATALEDDALSTQNPMLAILCSQHETQYSRLFRS